MMMEEGLLWCVLGFDVERKRCSCVPKQDNQKLITNFVAMLSVFYVPFLSLFSLSVSCGEPKIYRMKRTKEETVAEAARGAACMDG